MSNEISQTRIKFIGPDEMIIVSRAKEKMMIEGKILKKRIMNAWPVTPNEALLKTVPVINV